jgi:hypothetical protein
VDELPPKVKTFGAGSAYAMRTPLWFRGAVRRVVFSARRNATIIRETRHARRATAFSITTGGHRANGAILGSSIFATPTISAIGRQTAIGPRSAAAAAILDTNGSLPSGIGHKRGRCQCPQPHACQERPPRQAGDCSFRQFADLIKHEQPPSNENVIWNHSTRRHRLHWLRLPRVRRRFQRGGRPAQSRSAACC